MPSIAPELGTIASPLHRDGDDSGVYQTSPGLLRRVALAQWSEGLAQYLALRLGDARSGRRAYAQLTRRVKALPADDLIQNPGPKAQLYRLARYVADMERCIDGALPWRQDSGPSEALRNALDRDDSELLELRHARELSVREIAFVLDLPADEIELRVDTAEARGRRILGDAAPDPLSARATAYVEAFALERRWRGDDEAPTASLELADAQTLEPGTLIGGRYELVEEVGTGSFGDVYRAQDIEVAGHEVALKLLRQPSLSESARRAALRELKLNAAVFHPSLVQFKDHGWFEQRLWFVMPWYEGETLEARMARGPLGRAEAQHIFEPLARALAALHEAGIRHQDIKPENILLTRLPGYASDDEGILPVLIDLGVAAEAKETMLGGTPLYFAPEVARRFLGSPPEARDVDCAADVFALALSLRNALEPDTQDDVPAGAVQAFVERRAESLPPLPRAGELRYLRPTLTRWLSLDPDGRPSAQALADELAVLTLPEERRARRLRIARWVLPLVALFAITFSGAVYALSERAATEELRALRAQQETADVRADLIVENARRSALEEGRDALMARYEQSRLTRGQLANELATVEGQVQIVRAELARTLRAHNALEAQLTRTTEGREAAARERDRAHAQLAETRETLAETRTRESRLTQALSASASRATALETSLASRESERDAARRDAVALRAQLTDAEETAEQAENEAEQARQQLESAQAEARSSAAELARVRQQIDTLAATLGAPPAAPSPSVETTP
ncbi:MAG: protein kinase [Sandaracinaceae bacterium]